MATTGTAGWAGLLMVGTVMVLAAVGLAALRLGVPVLWVDRAAIAANAVLVLVLAFTALLGPGAWRLAGERRPLDEHERGELTAKDRVDAERSRAPGF